ncbi:MipA/OmpV family protein [Planctobacterium marinum]|uniref:Outer membrane MltA-interaction protein MipA n=1 Tax=Planctobacterium marinum TaxID=1631968 RepID=A0AA48HYU1_9ALTE|nr:outer membrane MltA-interaction protein MipA [Planctobacterium marinum]
MASYCLEKGQLEIAVGLGAGVRTNPLYQTDNTPLVVIPDIAWYGENWYLDNTEIGYQWIQQETFAAEGFVTLNGEYGYFRSSHFSNFVLDGSSISSGFESGTAPGLAPNDEDDNQQDIFLNIQVSPENVAKRKLGIDAGIRLHWYQGDNEWTLSAAHDINDVYQGGSLSANYRRFMELGEWRVIANLRATWKSAALLDYYYGIDARDTFDATLHYTAGSAWFTQVGLSANRKITENWRWLLHISYNHLPSAMSDSPLVDKNYTITTFAGVTYRF